MPFSFQVLCLYTLCIEAANKLNACFKSVFKLQMKKRCTRFFWKRVCVCACYAHWANFQSSRLLDCRRKKTCRDANRAMLYCFYSRPMIGPHWSIDSIQLNANSQFNTAFFLNKENVSVSNIFLFTSFFLACKT